MTPEELAAIREGDAHDLVPYPNVGKFAEVRMVYCRRCGATQPVEAGAEPLGPCAIASAPDEGPRYSVEIVSRFSAAPAALDVERLATIIHRLDCIEGGGEEPTGVKLGLDYGTAQEWAEAIVKEYGT